MNLQERPFTQEFDIIATKERLVLDIEKDKYPGEKVQFFLNGTTGEMSTNLEDVVREGVVYHKETMDTLDRAKKAYTTQYDETQGKVFFNVLYRNGIKRIRKGVKISWKEFDRFAIGKNQTVFTKPNGFTATDRSTPYMNVEKLEESLKNDGVYYSCTGKSHLPFTPSNFSELFDGNYVNYKNGSKKGFVEDICHIMPPVFNQTGNDYVAISDYESMYEYFRTVENGVTCLKKTGKKQDYIDKMVSYKLPDIDMENIEISSIGESVYKFAKIQKVEGPEEPTCVIRTFHYITNAKVLFEGGRIYVTKKTAEFCKKNNAGEYVAQPLLSKVHHWDFEIDKFPEDDTKGTMLEYFGQVVTKIEPENRAIAIWMFLKEPFLESLAKLSSVDFINRFIENLRHDTNLDNVYSQALGISKRDAKKVFQALGISKQQFESLKDILPECMPQKISICEKNKYRDVLTLGLIPFLKGMLTDNTAGDISSFDINTFNKYLEFAINTFSVYDVGRDSEKANTAINKVLELRGDIMRIFPTFNMEDLFSLFCQMVLNEANRSGYYYDSMRDFRTFKDYLIMANRYEDRAEFKPKFSSLEDMQVMHDNLSVLGQLENDRWIAKDFENRVPIWKPWEFKQEEIKDKNGNVKQEALPFIVIAPTKPTDLAKEGTVLHHCVKSYIERVAKGTTNIMFIRKTSEPDTPFFTVEVSNEKQIEQVHGLCNRNADTEPGLQEFVKIWANKKHLKIHGINKVR